MRGAVELPCARLCLTGTGSTRYSLNMQVRITIRGREYTVRGDDNEEDIQALAADIDRRMAETAERTRSFDEYSVAMLTALNIASELHALKREVADRLDGLDRDCASLGAMIEAALPPETEVGDE